MSTSNFKNADSILSVTLRKNQFSAEENSFIGRVTRNTVTLENLIASISEKNAGVSPYMIQHVANLLGDEMLSACQNTKAVDVLGLGTLYISVAGSVSGENPGESSIPGFKLNFTPSGRAQEAVDSLKVDKVIIADSSPVIDRIINTFNQNEERNLLKGKGVKITGTKLKILGDDAGIWFAPLDTEGNVNKDETTWIQVSKETVSSNKPKTLEFYIPDSLSEENYRIVIRTRYSSGDKELNSPVTVVSKPVTVAA
ncbi:DUF4469 domain-containing protein [uncultured Treponema sp.]|uniref:DUF4469 domain-containing protein n=1 Tax=uncultured Treponema sp. TaxID=162155 RepID=UPI0025D99178|nr:DUF4469 domain-containing protein [uncultured Treponema sp.]